MYVNHELENETDHGGFAKVSKISLNQTDGSIVGAELVINGTEEYRRLCSALLVEGYGNWMADQTYFCNLKRM
ncbi:MAG: hypothetical protein ACRD8Z_12625 [Nitrososphaeraceae archaeon]